jgi:hypothetical protein
MASTNWLDEGRTASAVDVAELLGPHVIECVTRMIAGGALVSLGTTSDGGALAITVTVDGKWRREYFRGAQDLYDWAVEGADFVESLAATPASSGNGSRSRRPRGR